MVGIPQVTQGEGAVTGPAVQLHILIIFGIGTLLSDTQHKAVRAAVVQVCDGAVAGGGAINTVCDPEQIAVIRCGIAGKGAVACGHGSDIQGLLPVHVHIDGYAVGHIAVAPVGSCAGSGSGGELDLPCRRDRHIVGLIVINIKVQRSGGITGEVQRHALREHLGAVQCEIKVERTVVIVAAQHIKGQQRQAQLCHAILDRTGNAIGSGDGFGQVDGLGGLAQGNGQLGRITAVQGQQQTVFLPQGVYLADRAIHCGPEDRRQDPALFGQLTVQGYSAVEHVNIRRDAAGGLFVSGYGSSTGFIPGGGPGFRGCQSGCRHHADDQHHRKQKRKKSFAHMCFLLNSNTPESIPAAGVVICRWRGIVFVKTDKNTPCKRKVCEYSVQDLTHKSKGKLPSNYWFSPKSPFRYIKPSRPKWPAR